MKYNERKARKEAELNGATSFSGDTSAVNLDAMAIAKAVEPVKSNTGIAPVAPTVGKAVAATPEAKHCYFCDPKADCRTGDRQFDPCGACGEQMKSSIILISKSDDPPFHRTGWRTLVSEEWVRRNVSPAQMVDTVIRARFAFVPEAAWSLLKIQRSKKMLYCVVVEYLRRNRIIADHIYCHADDMNHAKRQALAGEVSGTRMKIVAAAPVIGFFSSDEDGKQLTV